MKARKSAARKREEEERLRQAKAGVTVNVIRQNKAVDKLVKEIQEAMESCRQMSAAYDGQRELMARTAMMLRVMHSAMGMLVGNKLKLWMIDEKALADGIEGK